MNVVIVSLPSRAAASSPSSADRGLLLVSLFFLYVQDSYPDDCAPDDRGQQRAAPRVTAVT